MSDRDTRMDLAWDLLEQAEYEGALDVAEALMKEDPADREALYLSASARFEMGDLDAAEESLGRLLKADPSHMPARLTLASLQYGTCRFEEALEQTGTVLRTEPDNGYALYLQGLSLDLTGKHQEADQSFQQAARVDPERCPEPMPIGRAEFERAVEAALAALPAEFIDKLGNVPILVEEVPSRRLLTSLEEPDPDLLGLFVGTPLPDKSTQDLPRLPDAIYLFKRNLQRAASDRAELEEEIRVTLLHEIGHFLGMDEEDLEDAGYA